MLEVQFIGSGDAFGSGGRRNSAILLRERSGTILLDCGVTTLVGLRECGVDPREIDSIVISHFHADHAAGVPILLLTYLFQDRRDRPLQILGPRGIEEMVTATQQAFHFDTTIEAGARVGPWAVVGAGATVRRGSSVEHSLLLPNANPPASALYRAIGYSDEVWSDA